MDSTSSGRYTDDTHVIWIFHEEDKAIKIAKWLEKKEEVIREEASDCDNCDERAGEPISWEDLD